MVDAKLEVVLVEDDGGMRKAVTRMLTGAGYTVRAFESAEALIDVSAGIALKDVGRCLVCDVRLPGASGFELHRRMSERGEMPPWIFITAHDNQIVREQAERASAAYLLKPFEGRTLLALVARVIGPP
jgi:FixJ family two-component response regulator